MLTLCVKNQRFDTDYNMSLVTCSKVFRPGLNLFTPAADPSRFNGCRRFFLQKPSSRLFSRHRSKGNPHRKSGCPIFVPGLVVLQFSFCGNVFLYVSILSILFVFYLELLLCLPCEQLVSPDVGEGVGETNCSQGILCLYVPV